MKVYNSKPRRAGRAEGYGRADDHRRTRRRDESRARQKTTAELVSRMDEREPRMADTEDRLRRTMETILDRSGDPDGVPDQEPPA